MKVVQQYSQSKGTKATVTSTQYSMAKWMSAVLKIGRSA